MTAENAPDDEADFLDLAGLEDWDGIVPEAWMLAEDEELRHAEWTPRNHVDQPAVEATESAVDLDAMTKELREHWAWGDHPGVPESELRRRRAALSDWDVAHRAERPAAADAGENDEERAERLAKVREAFPMLDLSSLVDPSRPPRRWFWEGMVPEGEHVSIVAPAGEGKSLLIEALAFAAVRGEADFLGQPTNFPPERRVLIVDMENSEEDLGERLKSFGVTPDEAAALADRLLVLHLAALRGLDTAEGGKQLIDILDAYALKAGDVVMLDSTQRITEGEENSNDTVRRLYNYTSRELKQRGITVIRTDNTGKDASKGARGGSSKRDDVGASWSLVPDPNNAELFTLESTKRRAAGSSVSLQFRRWTDNNRLVHFDAILPASTVPTVSTTPTLSTNSSPAALKAVAKWGPKLGDYLKELDALVPPPISGADVAVRKNWGTDQATYVMREWRLRNPK